MAGRYLVCPLGPKLHLLSFVVDLFYNVLYNKLYYKSTTNRNGGVWAYSAIHFEAPRTLPSVSSRMNADRQTERSVALFSELIEFSLGL